MMARRTLEALLGVALGLGIAGCPPGDDDSADDDDSTQEPVGDPPESVETDACELPSALQDCNPTGVPDVFVLEFRFHWSDVDGDMNNPHWGLLINGELPWSTGRHEADLGGNGWCRIALCAEWLRESTITYEGWLEDDEGNRSDSASATYVVPEDEGDDDCQPIQD
jgi:hypothetical protein